MLMGQHVIPEAVGSRLSKGELNRGRRTPSTGFENDEKWTLGRPKMAKIERAIVVAALQGYRYSFTILGLRMLVSPRWHWVQEVVS
jgi:hypothetical protein